ncbi:protoheme IX farnesyltransferase [Saccharomycopsis crataegensis]|uniref:Protoheme IX farnesyltransferase, mitochondrial n=1 Tax=Saccharomycopsis crataegensis TaxID=43959 RepID=A0AAV5QR86_9ASCO|nr:protoheme IX farnesyltransferase [Saccharomycopsis crataegensis]
MSLHRLTLIPLLPGQLIHKSSSTIGSRVLCLNIQTNHRRSFATSRLQRTKSSSCIGDDFFLRNNLDKILPNKFVISCQPKEDSDQDNEKKTTTTPSHIPFKVTPKICTPSNKPISTNKKLNGFFALTKPNLTFLVMLSSICSYAIAPYPGSFTSLVCLTVGTSLCSGAANAINMAREPEFDRKMVRTSARPVVTGLISTKEAMGFAGVAGTLGASILYLGVNPLVAQLGIANIVLYAWTYTSLKRKHIINTWVGAVVGAIPPLMGWAAASGGSLSLVGGDAGAWLLASLLYAWQFPHFNALSHNIRDQYKQAGYVMTAYENPRLNARVALRYALLMFPICFGLSYYGITDWWFVVDSSLLNGWLSWEAMKFWKHQRKIYGAGYVGSVVSAGASAGAHATRQVIKEADAKLANAYAKKLFWGSVWQLPGILILALLHKKGIWDRWFGSDEKKDDLNSEKVLS